MRREAIAAGLLLLLILGTVLHLQFTDSLIEGVERGLGQTEQAARAGDYKAALRALDSAHSLWDKHRSYAQAFFRHPDLDALQDAFASLEQLLRQEDPAWPAALTLLRYHLEALGDMEHPSIRTIF